MKTSKRIQLILLEVSAVVAGISSVLLGVKCCRLIGGESFVLFGIPATVFYC